ncbi:MAG: hypothetical protein R3C49_23395 [Planctomycetaceae bacterium]
MPQLSVAGTSAVSVINCDHVEMDGRRVFPQLILTMASSAEFLKQLHANAVWVADVHQDQRCST